MGSSIRLLFLIKGWVAQWKANVSNIAGKKSQVLKIVYCRSYYITSRIYTKDFREPNKPRKPGKFGEIFVQGSQGKRSHVIQDAILLEKMVIRKFFWGKTDVRFVETIP